MLVKGATEVVFPSAVSVGRSCTFWWQTHWLGRHLPTQIFQCLTIPNWHSVDQPTNLELFMVPHSLLEWRQINAISFRFREGLLLTCLLLANTSLAAVSYGPCKVRPRCIHVLRNRHTVRVFVFGGLTNKTKTKHNKTMHFLWDVLYNLIITERYAR